MRWPLLSLAVLVACPAATPTPLPDAGTPPPEDAGPGCFSAFPEQLDFGEIEVNSNAFTRLRITNLTNQLLQPRPDPMDPPFFLEGQDFDAMSPGASILVTVRFNPADGLLHFGKLAINAAGGCRLEMPVRGLGKGAFSIAPALLDFGLLDPGESRTLELRLSNTQRTPVVFDRIQVRQPVQQGPVPFVVDAAAPLTIPPGGISSVMVTAAPPALEGYSAELAFSGPSAIFTVPLIVVGGAPVAQVEPAAIDVPLMDFSEGSRPPSFVERILKVKNVATDAGTLLSALQMVPPFFTGLNEDGGVTFDLLTTRLSPLMPGEEDELLVSVAPPGLGPRRYQLVLFTNNPRNPELQVAISVNAVSLPRCTLQYPSAVSFTAEPDAGSTGVVRFTNTSSIGCVLDAPRVVNREYRIIDGGVEQIELAPSQAHEIWISGPDAGSLLHSLLVFHVLGPNTISESIELIPPP